MQQNVNVNANYIFNIHMRDKMNMYAIFVEEIFGA